MTSYTMSHQLAKKEPFSMLLARTLLIALLVVSPLASRTNPAYESPQTRALSRISAEHALGSLSTDEWAELVVGTLKNPDRLPARYTRAFAQDDVPLEIICPTLALRDVVLAWDELSPETQGKLSEALTRHSTVFSYVTASGYFTLHYDTLGSHAIPKADLDFTGVPDYVERCAAYLDSTRTKMFDLGFVMPPSDNGLGGDSTFDVYFEEMGFYGYAVPENPGPASWNDFSGYLVVHRNFNGFPPNDDPEGDQLGAAKVTIAHEFHHCVQFGYDAGEGSWFMEMDATYKEDIIFDATDDNYNYHADFFSFPEKSLMEQSIHMYASFHWGLFISQHFDTSLMRAAWNGARTTSIYTALSDSLLAAHGWTQDSAFGEFAVWNFITGSRNDGLHHDEAGNYPLIDVDRTHSLFPVGTQNGPVSPAGYGAGYVQFFPGASVGTLRITVDGNDTRQWGFYVVKSTATNAHSIEKIVAPGPGYSGTVDIPNFHLLFRVALVAVNLTEFSSGATYAYSASIIPPYSVSSTILTDSSVYSGGNRQFQYNVSNTSILPDVFSVIVDDSLGWVTDDTLAIAIGAGDDTTVLIPVHPPQGTPLGVRTTLKFAAVSWGDSLVRNDATAPSVTMLQRGDVNFSGVITVSDITFLVNFLFNGGPSPIPVFEAGNMNCLVTVTVADLTYMINYLFAGGNPAPCNPY